MTDYVIAGGGVYGCGLAWELARRGAEVLVLERHGIASGASGGAGKRGVRANGRDLRELPLMAMAYDIWPDLDRVLGAPTGYERIGHLLLIERDRDLAAAPAQVWMQNRQGIPSKLLNSDEVAALEPDVSPSIKAAIYCEQDGVADHAATTLGYAHAARRAGAAIRERTRISTIETSGERISAVVTQGGQRISVDRGLILLSNSHVPTLLREQMNLALPVWSRLPQILLATPVSPLPMEHLIGHAHRRLAMKAGPQQTVMISGGWLGKWSPDRRTGVPVPDQVEANLAEAAAVYPKLAGAALRLAAADRAESESIDHIPIIDRVADRANLYYATGWSGHGWAIAPAVVRLLAVWILEGRKPHLLRPFEYGRFMG